MIVLGYNWERIVLSNNKESLRSKRMPKISVDRDRCKGCGICVQYCPQKILEMSTDINKKGYFYTTVSNPSYCIGCRVCAISCPDVAIEVNVNGVQYNFFDY
jgi:2-oxoglutarate ferredoxin oxidoreductase subunit delta